MGIERFFTTVSGHDITGNTIWVIGKRRVKADHLFVDFNSIIHVASQRVIRQINNVWLAMVEGKAPDRRWIDKYGIVPHKDLSKVELILGNLDLDELIIREVISDVGMILTDLMEPKRIKSVYLAIDGVPNKAKMVEQRKRRYMGHIITLVKKRLLENHRGEMGKMYRYEIGKISWNKSNITPGTEFMHRLYQQLINEEMIARMKKFIPNCQKWVVSGPYEPGEGEKKIVNRIYREYQREDVYAFYSPDSDVTLLSLLLTVPRKDFPGVRHMTMVRHNQQMDHYEAIMINQLANQIFSWVEDAGKENLIKGDVINEVVLLFTVFGNDFVPKIESINVKFDFQLVIDRYRQVTDPIITEDKKTGRMILHWRGLTKLFGSLRLDEGGQLQKVYLSSRYTNFRGWLHRLGFDANKLIYESSGFFNRIRKWLDGETNQLNDGDKKRLKRLVGNETNRKKVHDKLKKALRLVPGHRSIKDAFHYNRMVESRQPATQYHLETFQFDNMLDEYGEKMNAFPLQLGEIRLDVDKLKWEAEKIEYGVKKYYREHFNITDVDIKSSGMGGIVNDYLLGIQWVFDYYYNQYDEKIHTERPSTWWYRHKRAPLLTQIHEFLLRHRNDLSYDLDRYRIPRRKYFNCIEQYLYVSPTDSGVPEVYRDYLRKIGWFQQRKLEKKSINQLLSMIDCRATIFLNKCHLDINQPRVSDKDLLENLRKIPLTNENRKLTGNNTGEIYQDVILMEPVHREK